MSGANGTVQGGFLWWYRWARKGRFSRKDALYLARNRDKIEKVEQVDESGRVHQRVKP